MDEGDELLTCVKCHATSESTTDEDAPEQCDCCDRVLCWPCWATRHVVVFR
jgi:hypothetical protein